MFHSGEGVFLGVMRRGSYESETAQHGARLPAIPVFPGTSVGMPVLRLLRSL